MQTAGGRIAPAVCIIHPIPFGTTKLNDKIDYAIQEFMPHSGQKDSVMDNERPDELTAAPICPRCGGPIPNAEHPGEWCGAASIYGPHEICSSCGDDETDEARELKPAYPPSEWKHWPIE